MLTTLSGFNQLPSVSSTNWAPLPGSFPFQMAAESIKPCYGTAVAAFMTNRDPFCPISAFAFRSSILLPPSCAAPCTEV